MAQFSTQSSMALIAGDSTISVIASATVRPKIAHVVASSSSSPNDYSAHFHLQRFSSDGTADNAVAPAKLDFDSAVAIATSQQNYTIEPTVTADEILLNFGHNQRTTWQFVATPGRELVIPALSGDGLALVCKVVSTQFTEENTIYFDE